MGVKKTSIVGAGLTACLWLPTVNATTGLSALAGLGDFVFHLAYLGAYLAAFLLMIVFLGGRRTKVTLIIVFIAGLLFVPPFQYIHIFSIHYVQPVDNLPPGAIPETVEVMDEYILRRKNGQLVGLQSRFGGNANYWKIIRSGTQVGIENTGNGSVRIDIYDKKKEYEFRDIQSSKFGRNKIFIPIVAFEVPAYRILALNGRILQPDWRATGVMLYGAANTGAHPDWIQELINRGAEVNYQNPDRGDTALHRAIIGGHFAVAGVLLRAEAQPDLADNKGVRPVDLLMNLYARANWNGDKKSVQRLLMQTSEHWHASGDMLILASHSNSDPAWVVYLLQHSAPVNFRDKEHGNTALHLALIRRQYETAKLLISSGARPDIRNKAGKRPGDYIREILEFPKPNDDLAELAKLLDLVERDWRATGKMLQLPQDNPDWISILLQRGANPEFRNSNGDNALHYAIQMKNYANARALVLAGVDLNGVNGPGLTLLESLTLFVDQSESKIEEKQRRELIALVKSRL